MVSVAEQLIDLSEETWGERVTRARRRSGTSLKEAAAQVSRFTPASHTTLARLEGLEEPPRDARRVLVAYLTLLIYGYRPEHFGLDLTKLPGWLTPDLLVRTFGREVASLIPRLVQHAPIVLLTRDSR